MLFSDVFRRLMARNFLGDDLVLRKRLAKMIQSRREGVDEKQRVLSEEDSNPDFRTVVGGMNRPWCAKDSRTKQECQEFSEQFSSSGLRIREIF